MEACAASVIDDVDPLAYAFEMEPRSHDDSFPIQIQIGQLLQAICEDVLVGADQSVMAAQFHHAVAGMIVQICQLIRDERAVQTVGLTGGVFQNVLLLRLARQRLVEAGFDVLTHRVVPPNDGGIALGQAIAARK